MELKASDAGYLSKLGPKLQSHFRDAGVLLRPLGNTIYVLPPYCVTTDDLEAIYNAIETAADII
jgi:adenosylmethionine-8-amino-7-oxononanoate aminotransferase